MLVSALEHAAKAAGVEFIEAEIAEVNSQTETPYPSMARIVRLADGAIALAKTTMASSAGAAARFGAPLLAASSPLALRSAARAAVRLRFAERPRIAAQGLQGEPDAIFYLADSLDSITAARDQAASGGFIERAPLSFEADGEEIIVEAPYCPIAIRTDEGMRAWTEQDRQAFGAQVLQRVSPYLDGAAAGIRKIEVSIAPPIGSRESRRASRSGAGILAPPPSLDEIGAAARLALALVRDA
jgi:phytoene dehydrogenase-like protein